MGLCGNLAEMVGKYIVKNIPMSSRIHSFVHKYNFNHKEGKCYPRSFHSKLKGFKGSKRSFFTKIKKEEEIMV